MVVRLRLQRFGCKNQPFYRVVAADARAPRDGKFIEIVGTYNPIPARDGVKEVRFNGERIRYWLAVGAEPSQRVAWLLGQFGLLPLPPQKTHIDSHWASIPKKDRPELKQQHQQKKGFCCCAAALAPAAATAAAAAPLGTQPPAWLSAELRSALAAAGVTDAAANATDAAAASPPPVWEPFRPGLHQLTRGWPILPSAAGARGGQAGAGDAASPPAQQPSPR